MRWIGLVLLFLLPAKAALAHTGVAPASGFLHGFMHPVGGADHVLAMVAVGLLAWLLGGRARWLVPSAFLGMMAAGGVLGTLAVPLPFVEPGIALSVVVVGGLVALGRSLPVAAAMAVVGAFAVFHGHAHGTEMPGTASALWYGLAFILATALLHAAGLAAGFGLGRLDCVRGPWLARAGGAAVSVIGVGIFAGLL